MSISDDIKAAREMLAQARNAVPAAVKEAKEAAVTMVLEIDKLRAEAAAIRSELATLTNGGPAIDEQTTTPLPPIGPAVSYP
jgi:predicted  nucleic acid-binding Zn-ribbon protein